MERFVKGDIVAVNFPFSDLSSSKRRPALVLAYVENGDYSLSQITSKTTKDSWALELPESEIIEGELFKSSNIRPNRLFTADQSIILYKVGQITLSMRKKVVDAVIASIS
ncbi:MAG: type II toxin-antitoxin system PemK/MazF family toxin [Algoriphagus sp.]|uniref:type II toxin-antitoxin system PemK/MazF family toxin n=1 Tax=Algoriphagus sp. TaxID=1872435 RepID=UPI00272FB00C|nr:type II toxin-antitoxin system PemK/MazF family toxin [Algoriphagus sp.]MDP2043416.1 type II toxin-antitoxin system PemK/MazF family toxin [Algoriphagus sp.]MDP3470712.1 type II toxin-antitoxin system PemK/MazF family toxin [Algoriphagus sp.]